MTRKVGPTDPVGAVALLDEPKRRRLYELVSSAGGPVGRDEAAAALGISRELAAFHLDRLVEAGLLTAEYRRLGVRRGPGAGRPAKLYRRAQGELSVSLPRRDYERAAEVFAEALEQLGDGPVSDAIAAAARARGQEAGTAARAQVREGPARRGPAERLVAALTDAGYEPEPDPSGGTIRLRNCPFHALVAAHRELTCGMNLAWAQGLLAGLGEQAVGARLAPSSGFCCVVFEPLAGPT